MKVKKISMLILSIAMIFSLSVPTFASGISGPFSHCVYCGTSCTISGPYDNCYKCDAQCYHYTCKKGSNYPHVNLTACTNGHIQ